jgi:DNA adenine methylase
MAKKGGLVGSNPLKWHGGKHYLASTIIEHFPPHTHYVEPFFGGGAVLFAKPIEFIEGYSEVVNDLDSELSNFWDVLRDTRKFKRFERVVSATPFSKALWERSADERATSNVERAVNFFVRYRQSRQGLGSDFATMSRSRTRRGMNEQVSSWLSAVEGLQDAHNRLSRVVIFSEDACSVIAREDSPSTFFYLDPPYLHDTRTATNCYSHEMSEADHTRLLELLGGLTGKFLLSGFPSRLYEQFAKRLRWRRIETVIDNKASGSKSKPKRTECLWMNF